MTTGYFELSIVELSSATRYFSFVALLLLCFPLGFLVAIGMGVKGSPSQPSLIALGLVPAIAIIVFGVRMLPEADRFRHRFEAPVIFFVSLVGSAILAPIFASARVASQRTGCILNAKQIGQEINLYSADYDDRLPPSDRWQDLALQGHSMDKCVLAPSPVNYAMNSALSRIEWVEIGDPPETVLVFECDAYLPNASGGKAWFCPRHYGAGSISFVDGHATMKKPGGDELRWEK